MSHSLILTDEEIFQYHLGGKIGMDAIKRLADKRSLSIAYTPGVARPCLLINNTPDAVYKYTAKGNLVAIITDGSAVLGLGDIGPKASIPVMEGKAVLFKTFAKVDAWPVPLENCRTEGRKGPTDIEKFVDLAASLAVMYGGINLEDIAAPACFEIEKRLQDRVECPVFHDDQWGTAIITLAALKNYLFLSAKNIYELSVVINGAGAAGIRIAETIRSEGVKDLLLLDSRGVIHTQREDLSIYKRPFAVKTQKRTLADALKGADVFIGVSRPGLVTEQMILSMAAYPAIFAMANPDPEIMPEIVTYAMKQRPYVIATGRSDYPNQINNALGFPYIFRGALDVRASHISLSMKKAAAEAIAGITQSESPKYLNIAYPGEVLSFGPSYIIPKLFDKRLLIEVSYAVAKAARDEGIAAITDLSNYRLYLEALAYTPYENSELLFTIDGFCKFADHNILCKGHDNEGKKGSFLCSFEYPEGDLLNNEALKGRLVVLSLRNGKVAGISVA